MTKVNTEEYRNIDPNINSGCDSGAVACIQNKIHKIRA